MKKYKLLKDLPNLKAGSILTYHDGEYCIEKDDYGLYFSLSKMLVTTRVDWFEPVVEKTWEIVSMKSSEGDPHKEITESDGTTCKENGCKIHSVKRLSDGVVFTVGDYIKHRSYPKSDPKVISKFLIIEDKGTEFIRVDGDYKNGWSFMLDSLVKMPTQVPTNDSWTYESKIKELEAKLEACEKHLEIRTNQTMQFKEVHAKEIEILKSVNKQLNIDIKTNHIRFIEEFDKLAKGDVYKIKCEALRKENEELNIFIKEMEKMLSALWSYATPSPNPSTYKITGQKRYQMCKDQPAQIDCRITNCKFHTSNGTCSNVSPAITLHDTNLTCWSKEDNNA